MKTKITWRNVEFAVDDAHVRLRKTYQLNNAKVTLTLRLPEPQHNNPTTHLSVIDNKQLGIHYADNSQETKPLVELVQLFPAKLSSEQLQLYDSKGELTITHDNPQHNFDVTWGELRVHVDRQDNVLGELEQQNLPIVNNGGRGSVKHLLVMQSEMHHKENNLLIFYDHGCIELRNQFHYNYYLNRLKIRLKNVRNQAYTQTQLLWQKNMPRIRQTAELELITLLNKVHALTFSLNKMSKDPSSLTHLMNQIMGILDKKYTTVAGDFSTQDIDEPLQQFMAYAKSFQKKRYVQGIAWGTTALILGLAMTALMAVFFSGILFAGLGSIIVGCITATAALVTLITDVSYLKDTFQIGRMRANLNKLVRYWDSKPAIDHATDPLAQPLLMTAKPLQ